MSRKLLVVFGATGAQGSSVITQVLSDPTLSQQYAIRAITRDPSTPRAQALASSSPAIHLFRADTSDPGSLAAACASAHTVFGTTTTDDRDPAASSEHAAGKALADAAVAGGAAFLIWSTLPITKDVSAGRYTKIVNFDVKGRVEAYIRTLRIRSAFFSPGTFMSNFVTFMRPRPSWEGDGTYVLAGCQTPETRFPLINTEGDTGKWVAAMLAEPERFEGKVVFGTSGLVSQTEMAETFSRVTGKRVRYVQVEREVMLGHVPVRGEEVVEMMLYFQDFGYWGRETEDGVEWSLKQARGGLTSFEEYIRTVNPVELD